MTCVRKSQGRARGRKYFVFISDWGTSSLNNDATWVWSLKINYTHINISVLFLFHELWETRSQLSKTFCFPLWFDAVSLVVARHDIRPLEFGLEWLNHNSCVWPCASSSNSSVLEISRMFRTTRDDSAHDMAREKLTVAERYPSCVCLAVWLEFS